MFATSKIRHGSFIELASFAFFSIITNMASEVEGEGEAKRL